MSESGSLRMLEYVVSSMGGATREGQRQMCQAVSETFERGGQTLIQAGTGTGKSLGYLVPAALHALENDERVVVSTATRALQRQIITKDAPLVAATLEAATGEEVQIALLQGWHNYLCLHKVGGGYGEATADLFLAGGGGRAGTETAGSGADWEIEGASLGERLADQVRYLHEWAKQTESGDRDDLPAAVSDKAWRQVSVTSSECIGERCRFREECFAQAARRRAAAADVVVTNHAMLAIAASGHSGVLPDFGPVVVDEAHDLVPRMRSQAEVEISPQMLRGCAASAAKLKLAAGAKLATFAALLDKQLDQLEEGRLEVLGEELEELLGQVRQAAGEGLEELGQNSGGEAKDDGAELEIKAITRAALTGVEEACAVLRQQLITDLQVVAWCSRGREGDQAPRLHGAPLNIAFNLAENLWKEHPAVLTSATLQLGGSFHAAAFESGLALLGNTWRSLDVGSPFQYPKQGILYVAQDLPEPGREGHGPDFYQRLQQLVEASQGGALGLFSSRRAVDLAAAYLRENTDLKILAQGEGGLPALIEDFKTSSRACLLGTLSLWQGVDIPGDSCRLVVIDRIPFPVPSDPIISARNDIATKAKRNSFMEVSANHAALFLAQGVGRLIRSTSDRGVAAILDSRLATKRYGSYLRSSLPPMWYTTNFAQVLKSLQNLSAAAQGSTS